MDRLPNELIEKILCNKHLTIQDVCNFGLSSTRHYHLVYASNEIWKNIFKVKWNRLYNSEIYESVDVQDWRSETKLRLNYGKLINKQLSGLSTLHYQEDEMSNCDFRKFIDSINTENPHLRGLRFQIDQLEAIVNDTKEPHKNLTNKYYGRKVLRFLRHEILKNEWKQLLDGDVEDLFYGALLISGWFNTNQTIDVNYNRRQIELIAQLTVDLLSEKHPNHAFLKARNKQILSRQEAVCLKENLWPALSCRQILYCLNEVMFHELKFAGNKNDYYEKNNSFIDRVIESRLGIPITLCIVYLTVARYLGVHLVPVNFPGHFLIKWQENEDVSNASPDIFIDPFYDGRIMNHTQVMNLVQPDVPQQEHLSACNSLCVFQRMCRNLVEIGRQSDVSTEGLLCLRNALELLRFLSAEDTESKLLLSRVYIHLNINLEEVNEMLHQIQNQDPASTGIVMFLSQSVQSQAAFKRGQKKKQLQVKLRSENSEVKFSVGMLMKHKKYQYSCVIHGWDAICTASRDWVYQMGVHRLPNKDKQPFYNVLADDGSSRYAAQENLEEMASAKEISHPEVGKYFNEFSGMRYKPNPEKSLEYPED